MKKHLLIICILVTGIVFGESEFNQQTLQKKNVSVCQGHEMVDVIDGRLETAKRIRQRWDEKKSYDRSIKEYESEMYLENGEWVIEYSWKHVDNCPDCNKSIIADLSEPTPQN